MSTVNRLNSYLTECSKKYPKAWDTLAMMRKDRGKDLPLWPSWCYCPISGSLAVVSKQKTPSLIEIREANIIAALGSWHQTQGIYRFDQTLSDELRKSQNDYKLPNDVFYHIPEWCLYLETPNMIPGQNECGVFVWLEYDIEGGRPELRLLLDSPGDPYHFAPLVIHLNQPSLQNSLDAVDQVIHQESSKHYGKAWEPPDIYKSWRMEIFQKTLPLILYLCTITADIRSEIGKKPFSGNSPRPKEIPKNPKIWEIGFRIGKEIRSFKKPVQIGSMEKTVEPGTHASPRPHIRRAHWHHFWKGPRNESEKREMVLKWIPPIPINTEFGEIIPTYHLVRS